MITRIKSFFVDFKREIIVSLCTTGAIAFAQKIFFLIRDYAPLAGHSILEGLSNSFYVNLSQQTSSSMTTLITSCLFTICYLCIPMMMLFQMGRIKKKLSNNCRDLNNESEGDDSKEKLQIDRKSKKIKFFYAFALIVCAMCIVFFFFLIMYVVVAGEMWRAFQLDLIKIRPYISEEEYYLINSNWACMHSKADYDLIMNRIREIETMYNLI